MMSAPTEVALVGCGMPGRGMGWYHAKQILDGEVPSAKLTDVVEPWFLGGGADGPGGAEFAGGGPGASGYKGPAGPWARWCEERWWR